MDRRQLQDALGDAMAGAATPLDAANRLCEASVELLDVDGASVSYMGDGTMQGTFGSSGDLSRTLDELQFTYGEGPCMDAVAERRPVLAPHLGTPAEVRWPVLTQAILGHGIRAVFALPVAIASTPIGALDLYRHSSGPLDDDAMTGGRYAARLAALPLLDLMTAETDWTSAAEGRGSWEQLDCLERVEVYQATGMIIAALGISAADALARLRAYAVVRGLTASEVAYRILDRRLALDKDDWQEHGGEDGGAA